MKEDTPIAVTSRSFSKHSILRKELLDEYENVTFNDGGLSLKGSALISFLRGKEKAITALEVIDETVLTALPDLKVISKYGVGIDMIDIEAMRKFGIRLGWTKGVNKRSVSELVISFAISLLRHIPEATQEVREGVWRQHIGGYLSTRTVGIVGCGHVGKDLAILLHAFGCRVLSHDILIFPDFYEEHNVEPVSLQELLSLSDIVTLHLPLSPTTRNILSRESLGTLKPGAILINTARGGLVDEAALKEMLDNGHIRGAAFDVFSVEPPEDEALLNHPRMLATPHIGGSAEEAILAMGRAAIAGLRNNDIPEPDLS